MSYVLGVLACLPWEVEVCHDQVEIFNFPVKNFVPEQREGAHDTASLQTEGDVAVEDIEKAAAALFVFPHEGVVETEVKVTDCQTHHSKEGNHHGLKMCEGHLVDNISAPSLLRVKRGLNIL